MNFVIIYFYILIQIAHSCKSDESNVEESLSSCYNENEENDYSFVYGYLTGKGPFDFNDTITIGFLGAYGQAQVVLGALPLAINDVNSNEGKLFTGIFFLL